MKNSWTISLALIVSLSFFASTNAHADKDDKHFVLNLVGTAEPVAAMVPNPVGGEMLADCYEVDLIDLKDQKRVGTAVDCLTVQEVIGDFAFIRLIGTTTFHLKKGSFTTQGYTTVASAQQPTVSPSIGSITHITGAAGAENAVISGTKKFKKARGTSRLSGLVNLSKLLKTGEITFDCIFVVDLD